MTKFLTINLVQEGKVLGLAHKVEFDVEVDSKDKKAHGQLSYVEMYGNYDFEGKWRIVLAVIDDDQGKFTEFSNVTLKYPMHNSISKQTRNVNTFEKIQFISELPKERIQE